jgi:hypothetical protein
MIRKDDSYDITRVFRDRTPIDQALAAARREAVRQHKLTGQPLVTWRDGKVVLVPPDQVAPDQTR